MHGNHYNHYSIHSIIYNTEYVFPPRLSDMDEGHLSTTKASSNAAKTQNVTDDTLDIMLSKVNIHIFIIHGALGCVLQGIVVFL